MKKILFIGRFQPFHNGHLKNIKDALKFYDSVIIGIAASDKKRTEDNPFSVRERKKMIKNTLKNEKIENYRIICIKDYPEDEEWIRNIDRKIQYDAVMTGNPETMKLLKHKKIIKAKILKGISATKIRQEIRKGQDYKNLVPEKVDEFLEKKGKKIIINSS